jgi:branched-chain amino acid transport system permease protein
MEAFVTQFMNGLAAASSLFLVASGLSIIFGVTRIVNFAHGSFYMLGAYLAYSLIEYFGRTPMGFWGGVILAALAVGALGFLIEILLLRRIYAAPELFQLLATFGVVLILQDVTLMIWGPQDLLGPRAPGLKGVVEVLGARVPEFDIVLILLGPAVLGLLWLLFHKTRWGVLVRAATRDREMVAALGINQTWLFTGVFALGAILAGLGGALQLPRAAVNLHMDISIIVDVFVVVVIGGMGSVGGAFLAAVLISELNAFGILIFPKITLVLPFLVMAVVLVLRPWGLLGRPEVAAHGHGAVLGDSGGHVLAIGLKSPFAAAVFVLALMPLLSSDYALVVATEIMIMALFASSLYFLMGPAGLVSFGHAAYFGLGAYGAAMLVQHLKVTMELALIAAPLAAGLGALLFGWFCVRRSGVYFAMLTLAFAQIAWSIVFQQQDITGGDNGILGVWPSAWAKSKTAFFYLTLALSAGGIYLLNRILAAPFGYSVRAARDSVLRCDAIGIDVKSRQWAAFSIAGAFTGLAGGLYAFAKGSVFPDALGIHQSTDGLVMVLLGGIEAAAGPVLGAAVFLGLKNEITRHTDLWRLILGLIIVVLVLAFPGGIAGILKRRAKEAKP